MGKKNDARKDRQRADTIRKAERKLAEALAEVDVARAKVARRERKLSALLLKYGPADGPSPDLAVIEALEDQGPEPSEAEDDGAENEPDTSTDDEGNESA